MKKMALKTAILCLALTAALCGCPVVHDEEYFDPSYETPTATPNTPQAPQAPNTPQAPETPSTQEPYTVMLKAPSNLRILERSIEGVKITWDKFFIITGYRVYRSDSAEGEYQEVDVVYHFGFSSYLIQGLPKKIPYYYRVSAFDEHNNSGTQEGELSDYLEIIMPDLRYPPDSVTVTQESAHSVLVSWHTDYDDVQYNVYRDSVLVGTTSGQFYQDTGLSFGAVHKYTVTVVTDDGEGPQSLLSPDSSIKTPTEIPAITVAEVIDLTDSSAVRIRWELSSGANGYNVYRSTSADGPYTLIEKITYYGLTNYIDDKFTRNVPCYYKVSAVNEGGETELSEYARIIVWAAPQNLKAEFIPTNVSEDTGYINIRWNEYSGAAVTEYRLYRSTDSRIYTMITLSTNAWNDTGVEKNARYYYRVAAVVDGVESEQSPPVSRVARTAPYGAPGNIKISNALLALIISWDGVQNADSYRVYRDGSLIGTTTLPYETVTLVSGTHSYYVVAVNAAGEGPPSGTVSYTARN